MQIYRNGHRILNVTSQSLKLNNSLMRQYLAALRHQYTLYVVQVVVDLANKFNML